MASPTPEVVIGGSILAGGVFTSTFFGISLGDFASGSLMCVIGVAGRCAFDIQRTIASGDRVSMVKISGWASGGLLGAPFMTLLVMVGLKAITGVEPDSYTAFGLLTLGFGGPALISPIWGMISKIVSMKFGFSVPDSLTNDGDKDAKK